MKRWYLAVLFFTLIVGGNVVASDLVDALKKANKEYDK